MIRLLSWNMAHRDVRPELAELGVDVAMLREARRPRETEGLAVLPGSGGSSGTEGGSTARPQP